MTTADNLVKVEAAKKIYNSQPLDPSKQQIRLLSLFSSSSDDPLSGELRVISLQDGEKYSALSYVWGDEKFCPQMRLNGIDMTITSNLAIALRRLHSEGKARNIWIDAVCINQTDSAEKSHQVQMMKDIYANADLTLIWLGENADDSDLAMDLVSTISDEDFQQYTPEDPSWLALDPLFKRDWWTRMWIVQEAMLSPRPLVRCGAKEVELERFVDLKYLHEQHRETDIERFSTLRPFSDVPYGDLLWRNSKEWLNGALSWWIAGTRGFKCKYLRDRIYALLGLIRESSKEEIEVDYEKKSGTDEFVKSDREVVLEASVLLFRESGLLNLQFAQDEKNAAFQLPSWCPDWTTNTSTAFVPLVGLEFCAYTEKSRYRGPGVGRWRLEEKNPVEYSFFHFSRSHEILAVRGFIVDTIDFVNETIVPDYRDDASELTLPKEFRARLTLQACWRWEEHVISHKQQSYANTCGYTEAFWRTVVADRNFAGDNISASFKSHFDAWIGRPSLDFSLLSEAERSRHINTYSFPAITRCAKRAFVTTKNGYFGLAPQKAQVGDWVCILRGGAVAYVLRPGDREEGYCSFIGEAYVHGIMNGEYLQSAKAEDFLEFWIK